MAVCASRARFLRFTMLVRVRDRTRRRTMRGLLSALLGTAVAMGMGAISPTVDGGNPHWNRSVCGKNYVPISLGHGDYFNVYNEQDGRSCISAERHVLSWSITHRGPSVRDWEYPNIGSGIEWGRYTCYDGR